MKKVLFLGISQFAGYSFAYGFTWFVTKSFCPKTVGAFFIAFSICHGLCVFSRWGWGQGVLRYCAILSCHHPESTRLFFLHAIKRVFLRALIVLAVAFLLARSFGSFLGNKEILVAFYSLALFILFQPCSSVVIQYMRVLGRIKVFALLQYLIEPGIKLSILVIMTLIVSKRIFVISASVSLAQFLTFIMAVIVLRLWFSFWKNNRLIHDLLRNEGAGQYVKHIGVNLLLVFALSRGDILLGSLWLQSGEIASYQVAKQLSNIILISLAAFEPFVSPAIAQLFGRHDKMSILKGYHLSVYFLGLLTIAPVLILILHGKYILGIFGDFYCQSWLILRILVISQFINILTGQSGYILSMAGHSKYVLNNSIAAVIVTFVFIALLTPFLGTTGVALSVAAGIILVNVLRTFQIHKLEGIIWLNKETTGRLLIWFVIAFMMILPLSVNQISWQPIIAYLAIYYSILVVFHSAVDKRSLSVFLGIMLPKRVKA